MKYVFQFYRKEQLIWQITMESDDPKSDLPKLLEAYNRENEWAENERATTVQYCELADWLRALDYRGSQYKEYIGSIPDRE